ncbi:hypothetical protein [Streptomyces sp. DH37]|uniref:hypothetical protein n=1 Tax=Streptomyces sp. DH37 TaxID=3040122 RepID=UPI002442F58E|nr:hypothetical protein [Streptomyces sp. DH37]MDG9701726.1 hypothetical protein [Streptomyces sp. DH37]
MSPSSQADRRHRQRENIRRRLERYVYVLEFSSGTVKVGQTGDPAKRVKEHENAAMAHGISVARSWVSTPHVEFEDNEAALIAFCSERWPTTAGREAFESGDFAEVVEYAQGLPYTRLTEAVLEAHCSASATAEARGHAAFECRMTLARLNELAERAALAGSLVNDGNRSAACDAVYELAKAGVSLHPAPWTAEDPTAAERYLLARGAAPEAARRNATEFELSFRTLYLIEYRREAESFEDIARFCDAVTSGPAPQQQLGGVA